MRLVLLLTVSASPQAATERVKKTYIKWKSGGKPGGGKTGEGKVTGGKWSEKWSEKRNKVKCKDVGKVLLMWSSNCLSHTHPTHTHSLSHSLTHTRAQSHVKNSVTLLRENWKKKRKEKLKNCKSNALFLLHFPLLLLQRLCPRFITTLSSHSIPHHTGHSSENAIDNDNDCDCDCDCEMYEGCAGICLSCNILHFRFWYWIEKLRKIEFRLFPIDAKMENYVFRFQNVSLEHVKLILINKFLFHTSLYKFWKIYLLYYPFQTNFNSKRFLARKLAFFSFHFQIFPLKYIQIGTFPIKYLANIHFTRRKIIQNIFNIKFWNFKSAIFLFLAFQCQLFLNL